MRQATWFASMLATLLATRLLIAVAGRIFMGDSGSMFLGFMIAGSSVWRWRRAGSRGERVLDGIHLSIYIVMMPHCANDFMGYPRRISDPPHSGTLWCIDSK